MTQTTFETKQRANELLQKAIEIWRGSEQSDFLEGIETDPVFSLLMTALAYQANETENEIDQMKNEVLEEFANMLTPFELGHAIPATAVVEAGLQKSVQEMILTPSHVFTLGQSGEEFIPLLQTKVINASVRSVNRLDGRRWKVSIAFKSPVSDLSGFTFAVRNHDYRDLRVSLNDKHLPLIKSSDYSELPLSPCFALDTVLYNKSQTYMASSLSLDLFARQNIRMYCVRQHQPKKLLSAETDWIDLIFEFMGIGDKFEFNAKNLSLNVIVLVNAQQRTATLSSATPIVRVTGNSELGADQTTKDQQFLHLLRPTDDQLYGNTHIEVRRMAADRFNHGRLLTALNNMLSKYYTDYYAFANLGDAANDKVMHGLTQALMRMVDAVKKLDPNSFPGVYLLLRDSETQQQQPTLEVSYLTTQGAAINGSLSANSQFVAPAGFDSSSIRQIAAPVPGFDEVRDERATASMARYYLATNDRLVTPADIKQFCYFDLQTRYGIVRDMIKSVTVMHRQQFESAKCGYEILVEIILVDNSFVKRGFSNKIEAIEKLIENMIKVRSVNIYPVRVTIRLEDTKQ